MSLRTSYPVAHHVARARVPSRGYGLRKHSARRHLRASRRGIAALTATLFLAGILLSLSSLWAAGQARQKIAGEAALVAEAVARAGYGLHHWLHEGGSEDLHNHGAWANWAQPPRGWQIIIDTANIEGLPHGILIVRPPEDENGNPGCTTDRGKILHSEVAQRLGVVLGNPDEAAGPALVDVQNISTEDCDLVVYAHTFSRIDPSLVLREPRAGFSTPVMETDINMGGQVINCKNGADEDVPCDFNIGTLVLKGNTVGGADPSRLTINEEINGSLVIEQSDPGSDEPVLTITGEGDATADLNITGNLAVRNDMTLTTLGQEDDRVTLRADFGAIDRIPGSGDGPDITVNNRFFCGTGCRGAP